MPYAQKTTLSLQAAQARFDPSKDKGRLKQFYAVVTYAGRLSDKPVTGTEAASSDGRPLRVLIPKEAMCRRVDGLRGKPLYATPHLRSHAGRSQIGHIAESWLDNTPDGDEAPVQALGYLDSSIPLAGETVKSARSGKGLAVSVDINAVRHTVSKRGAEEILVVEDFEWEGATALDTEKAAYGQTRLAAATAEGGKGDDMSEKDKAQNASEIEDKLPGLVEAAVKKAIEPVERRLAKLEKPDPEPQQADSPAPQPDLRPVLDAVSGIAEGMTALKEGMEEMKEGMGNAPVTNTVTAAQRNGGQGGVSDEIKDIDAAISAVQRGALARDQKMAAVDDLRQQRTKALFAGQQQ